MQIGQESIPSERLRDNTFLSHTHTDTTLTRQHRLPTPRRIELGRERLSTIDDLALNGLLYNSSAVA